MPDGATIIPEMPAAFECPRDRREATYTRVDGQAPGYRLCGGKPLCFDMGEANDYRADVRVWSAPGDLTALPYEAGAPGELSLTGLKYAAASRRTRLGIKGRRCKTTEALSERLWAEIATRPEYQRVFGPAPIPTVEPVTARVDMAAVERVVRAMEAA